MLLSPRPWHSDAVRMWQAIEPTKLMMMIIVVVMMMMVVMVMTMVNLLPEIGDDIPKVTNQTDKNIEDEPKDDNREEGAIAQRYRVLELVAGQQAQITTGRTRLTETTSFCSDGPDYQTSICQTSMNANHL